MARRIDRVVIYSGLAFGFLAQAECTAPALPDGQTEGAGGLKVEEGTGGTSSSCFCPPIVDRGLEIEADLECLCSELGCPESVAAATKPFQYWSKLTLKCGGATEVAYNGVWSQWVFSFDKQGSLTGASFETDYPAYCGAIKVHAGSFLHEQCREGWCMITDGLREAEEGECLEREPENAGGLGGSTGAGGGAGSAPIDK